MSSALSAHLSVPPSLPPGAPRRLTLERRPGAAALEAGRVRRLGHTSLTVSLSPGQEIGRETRPQYQLHVQYSTQPASSHWMKYCQYLDVETILILIESTLTLLGKNKQTKNERSIWRAHTSAKINSRWYCGSPPKCSLFYPPKYPSKSVQQASFWVIFYTNKQTVKQRQI